MNRSWGDPHVPIRPESILADGGRAQISSIGFTGRNIAPIRFDGDEAEATGDPGTVVLTCANCGAAMDERKCKLVCRCGCFLSCSDYS